MDVRSKAAAGEAQPEVDRPKPESHHEMLLRVGEDEPPSRVLRGGSHERVDIRITTDDAMQHDEIVRLFADRLREIRRSRGMTQAELARQTSLTVSYVSRLETGYMPGPKRMTFMYDGAARPV